MSNFLQDAAYEARGRYTSAASAKAFHAGATWAFDRMRAERDALRRKCDELAAQVRIARGAIRELEAKVFSQEQALCVMRASIAQHERDIADPPGYLQDAVIALAGLGALHLERDAARAESDSLRCERDELARRNTELAARLAKIEAQETVAWIEHELQGTGLRHLHFERRPSTLRDDVVAPVWTELIARPAPAAAPERAEPTDPLDWPLPCDVSAGHVTIRKGVALRALVARVEVLTKMVGAATDAPSERAKAFADCMDRTREARRKMIPCRCGPDGCPDSCSCPKGGAA